jgi:hypothetical protein
MKIMKRWFERESIKAVHDDDLSSLLNSLNLEQLVTEGKVHCLFCQRSVSSDNIGALVPRASDIAIVCEEPECLAKLAVEGEAHV